MGGSLRLGKVLGITVQLHYSWFIIFALLTLLLSFSFFDEQPRWISTIAGLFTSVLLFASVLAHELAHSLVAVRNGIPVKNITLFFLGGVAHITREAPRPKIEFLVAVAGPLCSLSLAAIFSVIWFVVWSGREEVSAAENPVLWLALINVALALFNLIPGYPLDGGRILHAIVWRSTGDYARATRIASMVGRGVFSSFIGYGVAMLFSWYVFSVDLSPFGNPTWGFWLIVMGWFLLQIAVASRRQGELRRALSGLKARSVMDRGYVPVPPNLSVSGLEKDYILRTGRRHFVVADGGKLEGMVNDGDIKSVSQAQRDNTPVSAVMVTADKVISAHPEDEALDVLERLEEHEIDQMPVVQDRTVLGMIDRQNLLRFVKLRSKLGA